MSFISKLGIIFAKKWIGGVTISDAISESKRLNSHGEKVIINFLGEDIKDKKIVSASAATYLNILKKMSKSGVAGSIAVKPTQLGLSINYATFLSNYKNIVKHADKLGIFVWMDMEDYQTVDSSIKAYISVIKANKNAGICIQSKLKRSLSDIKNIRRHSGIVRLVKGAYPLRKGITYMHKPEIDRNFLVCMDYLFNSPGKFMIATHDYSIILRALSMERKLGKKAMFGMLKGIRPSLANKLASEKEDINIYVPFGEEWLNYSLRRLKELEHSMLIIRSIFSN